MHNATLSPRALTTTVIITLVCLFATPHSHAEDEPPFKATMLTLLENSQAIVDGIMREDYSKVASMAEAIAFHQSPSSSKRMAILNELGIESMNFTLFDDNLRTHATKLKKLAEKGDGKAVLNQFAEMMQSCANCHSSYRKRLRTLK